MMIDFLAELPRQRWPWLLLATTALGLELTALYFQYGMALDPCVLCVYERVAVAGILLAGLLGAVAPQVLVVRLSALLLWLLSAGWGLSLALEHVGIQWGEVDLRCTYLADFPSWAPLDVWWPAVFQPTGLCGEVQWAFLGLSMPGWMAVIYGLYLLAWLLVTGAGLGRMARR
ncbi:disulfide bond formation protein DsbB [endosymbiont of unidentified scaly snail isolate Monju]|nr:disulfide bond formation protein DsbB [endosymbiont of unidentified scaly snail isolate Monju]